MLRQLGSAELRAKFAAPQSADAVVALTDNFVEAIRAGTHREQGWSDSMYGVSKLAEISYTIALAEQVDDKVWRSTSSPAARNTMV